MMNCPCGSGKTMEDCCRPYINGEKIPATALELLRSRYTAYTEVNMDYILETSSKDVKKDFSVDTNKSWAEKSVWKKLEIISSQDRPDGEFCDIEFIAHYESDGIDQQHHEASEFRKIDGRWYFNGCQAVKGQPYVRPTPKIGLNSKCPCGSGKKYKKCCAQKQ